MQRLTFDAHKTNDSTFRSARASSLGGVKEPTLALLRRGRRQPLSNTELPSAEHTRDEQVILRQATACPLVFQRLPTTAPPASKGVSGPPALRQSTSKEMRS